MRNRIEEVECGSVREFWQALSPVGGVYDGYTLPVFRGQANSEWLLTPSALRHNALDEYFSSRINDGKNQLRAEYFSLKVFSRFCNDAGLVLPVDLGYLYDNQNQEETQERWAKWEQGQWPPREIHSLIALAQHHGIPTRLLDWTFNPFVASYFSAKEILGKPEAYTSDGKLAVWVTQKYAFEQNGLCCVNVPAAITSNISAQQGFFSLLKYSDEMPCEVDLSNRISAKVWKVTLSWRFAAELMMLCHDLNISAATMFPGYDGAAMAVKEINQVFRFGENNG